MVTGKDVEGKGTAKPDKAKAGKERETMVEDNPTVPEEYFKDLGGREHDEWGWYEKHWNALRNLFPQCMRCQEKEDALTDNYCDLLGPRSLGPRDRDGNPMSCLPTSTDGVLDEEQEVDYKTNVMPNLILPQWEYKTNAMAPTVSLSAAMADGSYSVGTDPEELVSAGITYDENHDRQQYMKSRFISDARALTESEMDLPLSEGGFNHWSAQLHKLKQMAAGEKGKEVVEPVPGVPFLDRSRDKYELATWQWIRARIYEEQKEIARHAVRLFPNIIIQMICACVIWGLGATEIDGGKVEVVIASFAVGIVCVISGVIGIIGICAENELFLRMFWIAQLWVLSLLTAFLYVETRHASENNFNCNPTNSNLGPKTNCDSQEANIYGSMIVSVIELVLCFMSVYMTTAIMDSINDKTAIEDSLDVFKYLQYYLNELLRRGGLKETGTGAPEYVDPLAGPERTRMQVKGVVAWTTAEDVSQGDANAPDTDLPQSRGDMDEATMDRSME